MTHLNSRLLSSKERCCKKKLIQILYIFFITVLLVGCGANSNEKQVKVQNPYQNYIDQTVKNVFQLSGKQKKQREWQYDSLKKNSVYITLVTNNVVSVEYLPVINCITRGVESDNIKTKNFINSFSIEKRIANAANGKDKMDFYLLVTIISLNGGFPSEIIDVFERYKNAYGIYGEKGILRDINGIESDIEFDYDLSPFFGIILPTNTEVLNKIYEAKQKGLSNWLNIKDPVYPYLTSKQGYIDYVNQIYPESPYLPKVDAELTAYELYNAYEENEVAADLKYKGKKIAITGRISSIGKDIANNPYVSLRVDYFKEVTCCFSEKRIKEVSRLGRRQRITIIGECSGLTLTNVVIQNCEVWECQADDNQYLMGEGIGDKGVNEHAKQVKEEARAFFLKKSK